MRYDDGSRVSRSKVLFLWFFCLLYYLHSQLLRPSRHLSSPFGPIYKLFWLDYGVSLFFSSLFMGCHDFLILISDDIDAICGNISHR